MGYLNLDFGIKQTQKMFFRMVFPSKLGHDTEYMPTGPNKKIKLGKNLCLCQNLNSPPTCNKFDCNTTVLDTQSIQTLVKK